MPGLLDRLAKRLNRKLQPTAVAMGAENAPTTATGAAAVEIKREEAEKTQ